MVTRQRLRYKEGEGCTPALSDEQKRTFKECNSGKNQRLALVWKHDAADRIRPGQQMNSKLYRCGWCGHPTNHNGVPLKDEQFKRVIIILSKQTAQNHTCLVHGECCLRGADPDERPYIQITRDMAIDAGDRSLEGQWIKW